MYQNLNSLEERQPVAVAIVATGEVVAKQFAGCNVGGVGYMPYIENESQLAMLRDEGVVYEWVDC